MTHSAYMLNAMWVMPPWANAEVRNRHGSLCGQGRHERDPVVEPGHRPAGSRKTTRQMPMIVIVATGRPSVTAPPKTVRAWRTVFGALGDAVDALDADRGRPLALRAGGPHAPLAAHVRLAVRVPRAHRNLLHGIRVWPAAHPRRPPFPCAAARASAGQSSISTRSMTTSSTRLVHRPGRHGGDLVDDLAARAVGDLAEDRVLAVEPRGRRRR